ncbi:hypothetical protein [Paenibacillus mucilaginosus]|uniref:Uncharacterized protein n=1 Tax=Paenibacillus mucilaginosus (strain KNP414) TaxID=1036673 RepID=F8FN65_PAEMK|nr:hypothetical protein [Paenibacillus mucilaginosus]AEI45735.1 hypothetical protein KNP414_07225 [Paenibacillus mucilaginosus KNP414]MCG7215080.1 hypothetical protein [Paenibacillus mucilaginosus]WDM27120.1 hypothetical protein KCX80_32755 [Paenibacillus mucilaginosus]
MFWLVEMGTFWNSRSFPLSFTWPARRFILTVTFERSYGGTQNKIIEPSIGAWLILMQGQPNLPGTSSQSAAFSYTVVIRTAVRSRETRYKSKPGGSYALVCFGAS